ncbi:hypothetical protein [Atrimonas thermophila]|jgi:hypothetical protein|uniref:hypothetical protein n=1 Tax=Atrimonas thermophila TaxID=3064161 RepID=UPI00399D2A75
MVEEDVSHFVIVVVDLWFTTGEGWLVFMRERAFDWLQLATSGKRRVVGSFPCKS